MEMVFHRFPELFAKRGLDADLESIRSIIATHAPLSGDVCLKDAPFWIPAQTRLLREALIEDADWDAAVHRLDFALRTGWPSGGQAVLVGQRLRAICIRGAR